MRFAAAMAGLGRRGEDPDLLAEIAELALAEGEERAALEVIVPAAGRSSNARLWQWAGLLHRSLDDRRAAIAAFSKAAALAPADASIAHGHARVMLEAGADAVGLFERAMALGPSTDIVLGRTAALFARGEGGATADEMEAILAANPLWAQGHVQFAQLCSMIGQPERCMKTIDQALSRSPGEMSLWQAAIHILASAGRNADAWHYADRAIAATANPPAFALGRAAALSDAGETVLAEGAFESLGKPLAVDHAIYLARHLIRSGRIDELAELTDRWMDGDNGHLFWPYASICWRLTGDPRWQWLEGDPRLVQLIDLREKLPSLEALAERLRQLHRGSGRFLDQSVRGGTQTDGPLLSRIEPEIVALRSAIADAVEAYRAQLPPVDPSHPMLRHKRSGNVRFAGSWSVRLADAGFHTAHVHPQGWISSAFYVSVPRFDEGEEGWLVLGEPPADLASGLEPLRKVRPSEGQLVLFPSMMWHGTLPFKKGERMTVAFDVAPTR